MFLDQFRRYYPEIVDRKKKVKRKKRKKKAPPKQSQNFNAPPSFEPIPRSFYSARRRQGLQCARQLQELSSHYESGLSRDLPNRSFDERPSGFVYPSRDTTSILEPFRKYTEEEDIRVLPPPEPKVDQYYEDIVKDVVEDRCFVDKEFHPLTQKQSDRARDIINYGNPREILFDLYNVKMTRDKMRCLRSSTWLNDEVMNFYVNLMRDRNERTHPFFPNPVRRKLCKQYHERRKKGEVLNTPNRSQKWKSRVIPNCYFFNTFFYFKMYQQFGYNHRNVTRWTRTADLFLYDKIIVPVHLGNHWVCGVVNLRDKRFEYYDSLFSYQNGIRVLNNLKRYMEDEYLDKKKTRTNMFDSFQFYLPQNVPHQNNGFDCGVFALKFASFVSQDLPFTFHQDHMSFFRKKIAIEIMNCFLW